MQNIANPGTLNDLFASTTKLLHTVETHPRFGALSPEELDTFVTNKTSMTFLTTFSVEDAEHEELSASHSQLEGLLNTLNHLDESAVDESTSTKESTWQTPTQLPSFLPSVPLMTPDMLPEPLATWIQDEAERSSVYIESIATPAVVSLATAIGRTVGIFPKQLDTWFEVAMLWGMLVANPSTRKSNSLSAGTRSLLAIERERIETFNEQSYEHLAQTEIFDIQIKNVLKELSSENPGKNETELKTKLAELRKAQKEHSAITAPRLVINDATIEKIGELLAQNPKGLMYFRDELSGLLATLDKPNHEADRAYLLEAWNGKNSFSTDRISRSGVRTPALALSISGGIQPGKLTRYITGAVKGDNEADGLLQRFQLLIYPDNAPPFTLIDRLPDDAAHKRADNVFRKLVDLDVNSLEVKSSSGDVPGLRFTLDAQEVFNKWLQALQDRLATPELIRKPAFQAHLAKYPSLVTRLALVFHLVDVVDGRATGGVSLEALRLAIRWSEYLEAHARKLYAAEFNPELKALNVLAQKVRGGEIENGVTIREGILRQGWTGLKDAQTVKRVLAVLQEHHWLRIEKVPTGSRPSEVIIINPNLKNLPDMDDWE
jgi:hypothetical protein